MISFTIDMVPESMQSETIIGFLKSKDPKKKGRGMMFNTARKKAYLAEIAFLARKHVPAECPWLGAVGVEYLFCLPRPKYAMEKKYDDGLIWAPSYPDLTNLIKAFEDGLSGAMFWKNDSQIVRYKAQKVLSEKLRFPRVEVKIEELGGPLI